MKKRTPDGHEEREGDGGVVVEQVARPDVRTRRRVVPVGTAPVALRAHGEVALTRLVPASKHNNALLDGRSQNTQVASSTSHTVKPPNDKRKNSTSAFDTKWAIADQLGKVTLLYFSQAIPTLQIDAAHTDEVICTRIAEPAWNRLNREFALTQ